MFSEILVSVIIPCFNASNTIKRAVDSVLKQKVEGLIEIIIIDDNSKDGTFKYLEKLISNENFIFRILKNERNKGVGFSRRKGIEVARGEFIAFLDSDDFWLENKLEKQLDLFKNKNNQIVFSDYFVENNSNKKEKFNLKKMPSYVYLKNNQYINNIPNSTAVVRSKTAKKIKYPLIKLRNDFIYWNSILEMSSNYQAVNCNPGVGYSVYGSKAGISNNKFKLLSYQWETYRKYFNYSKAKSLKGIIFNIINSIAKIRN